MYVSIQNKSYKQKTTTLNMSDALGYFLFYFVF